MLSDCLGQIMFFFKKNWYKANFWATFLGEQGQGKGKGISANLFEVSSLKIGANFL